jgi:chain length determinant protein tyrosine kinase EpsG
MQSVKSLNPAAKPAKAKLIGELLHEAGKLTEPDLSRVLVMQRTQQARFGETALSLGLVSEQDIRQALARQFHYPYADSADSKLSPLLAIAHQPFAAQAETVRALRAELTLRGLGERHKMLAVAGARHGDGSSITAANLALSFAQLGQKILLVDANLRRPAQHDLFAVHPTVGLADFLAGRGELKHALSPVAGFDTLKVLCAGLVPPNPNELLSSAVFEFLCETAASNFDVTIVDTSPVLDYPDTQIVAARAGAVLLSARRHHTATADLVSCQSRLKPTGATVLGAVLNA